MGLCKLKAFIVYFVSYLFRALELVLNQGSHVWKRWQFSSRALRQIYVVLRRLYLRYLSQFNNIIHICSQFSSALYRNGLQA